MNKQILREMPKPGGIFNLLPGNRVVLPAPGMRRFHDEYFRRYN